LSFRDIRSRLGIVLVEPEGAINLGFIIRLVKNFGLRRLYIINPKFDLFGASKDEVCRFAAQACDLLDTDVIRVLNDFRTCLSNFSFSICTTAKGMCESDVLRQAVSSNYLSLVVPSKGDIALVFGRESVGLRRDELALCDLVVTIDTGTNYPTMNLSHAVAIILYSLLSSESAPKYVLTEEADTEKIRYVINIIRDVESSLGVDGASIAMKHILFRSKVTKAEITVLYKLFKRIKYSIKT